MISLIFALVFSIQAKADLNKDLEACWKKSQEFYNNVKEDENGNIVGDPWYSKKLENDSKCYALKRQIDGTTPISPKETAKIMELQKAKQDQKDKEGWEEHRLKNVCIPRTVLLKKKPTWNLPHASENFEEAKKDYLKQTGKSSITLEEVDKLCLKLALKNICPRQVVHENGVNSGYFVWGVEDLKAYLGNSIDKSNFRKHCP